MNTGVLVGKHARRRGRGGECFDRSAEAVGRGGGNGARLDSGRGRLFEVQRLFGLITDEREQRHARTARLLQRGGPGARNEQIAGGDDVAEARIEGAPARATCPRFGYAVEAKSGGGQGCFQVRRQAFVAKVRVQIDRREAIACGQTQRAARLGARAERGGGQGREAKAISSLLHAESIAKRE